MPSQRMTAKGISLMLRIGMKEITYSGIPLNVCLSRAEETLSCLLNKHRVISGNKVQYSGTMVNGTTAEHTQHHHAAKWRAIKKEVQDSIRKTQANGKKKD